jgi:ABC-type bacteriocin/lantibiotic exporter with double-glycine peptidase domain
MITATANTLQIGISEKLSICLQFTALVIGAYVVAFKYCWQLTLVSSSMLLFVLVVFGIIIPISLKLQKSVDHANEKAGSIASEVLNSIRMVVACGAEKRVVNTYSKWIDEARQRGLKLSPVLGSQFAPVFFAIYGDFALTFWFGVKLYNSYDLDSVGTVLM